MDELVKGQIVIKFRQNKEPEVEFLGLIDPIDIQAMVYKIRMGYQLGYLAKRGDELKRRVAEEEKQRQQAEANRKKE